MAVSSGIKISNSGLVFLVDAADKNSYAGSGTTWTDLTGNGFNFSTSDSPSFTTDSAGRPCWDFTNGQGHHFDSVINSPFTGNSFAITVQAVVNQNSNSNFLSVLSQHENDANDAMCFLSLDGKYGTDHWNPGGFRMQSAAPNNEIQIVTWALSAWSQHTSNNEDIYLNGTTQTTEAYSVDAVGSLVADVFRIGNWQLSRADMDWDGQIYSVCCYDRKLSQREVIDNANSFAARFAL